MMIATEREVARVLKVLQEAAGETLSRSELCARARVRDRVARDAIRQIDLTDDHNAVAHDPKGGYRLERQPQGIIDMADQLQRRIAKLSSRERALRRTAVLLDHRQARIPGTSPMFTEPMQWTG